MIYKWYKDSYYLYKQLQEEPYRYSYISIYQKSLTDSTVHVKYYFKSFDALISLKVLTIYDIINLNMNIITDKKFIKDYLENV